MPLEDAPLLAFPVPLPRQTSPLLANCLISVSHFYLPVTHLRAPDPFVMRSYLSCVMARGERARTGTGTRWMRPRRRGERREERRVYYEGREGGRLHSLHIYHHSPIDCRGTYWMANTRRASRQTPLLTPLWVEKYSSVSAAAIHFIWNTCMRCVRVRGRMPSAK